jgi:dolichol kinase
VLEGVLYFALVLALGETGRRRMKIPSDVTRKGVLAAVAAWTVPAVSFLADPRGAAAAFLALAAALYLSFRFEILKAIEDEGPTLGSVLTPLSAALLLLLLSLSPHIAAASALSMAGDAAAALVGRRLGTRRFHVSGHSRTMEGTLALFLVASASMAPVLVLLGGLDWHQAVAFALIAGTVGASVETVSVYGSDNATVPLSVAATLLLLTGATG